MVTRTTGSAAACRPARAGWRTSAALGVAQRSAVVALAALLGPAGLTGCDSGGQRPSPPPTTRPSPPPPPAAPEAAESEAPASAPGEEAQPGYDVAEPFRFAGVNGRRTLFTLDGRHPTAHASGAWLAVERLAAVPDAAREPVAEMAFRRRLATGTAEIRERRELTLDAGPALELMGRGVSRSDHEPLHAYALVLTAPDHALLVVGRARARAPIPDADGVATAPRFPDDLAAAARSLRPR